MSENERNDDDARAIGTTRVFDAPRELVFRMWIDRQHIAKWWGPRGFTTTTREMDVRPGGKWLFTMHGPDGTDYPNEVNYREVVAPERLVYDHGPEPLFHVTVTFKDLGEKTEVSMRSLFESAEIREKVAKEYGAVDGMNQTLDRLGEQLKTVNPDFLMTRVFDAPRDLVFRVWTECDHLMRWWGPKGVTMLSCKQDLRPGGMYLYGMRTAEGDEIWGKWIFREIVRPERLHFIVSFSDPEGGTTRHPMAPDWPMYMLSTITFDEQDGKTAVTVRWSAFEATDEERRVFDTSHASLEQGWGGTMERLETYLVTIV